MRWVESVESHDDHCVVRARVSSEHILAESDGIDSLAGIELLAQGVAASVTNRHPERAKYIGLLLAVKRYQCEQAMLDFGDYEIEVRDSMLLFDEGLGTFNTRLLKNGEEVGSGQIKAFLANNDAQQKQVLDGLL